MDTVEPGASAADGRIRKLVEAAPPLTEDQGRRLAALFLSPTEWRASHEDEPRAA